MIDNKNHETWNDEMAKKHNPDAFITQTSIFIRLVEAMRLRRTSRFLSCTNKSHVLDLGCGAGNLFKQLKGEKIIGMDLSDFLLEKAKERAEGRPEIEVVKANAEKIPFKDNTFDRAVCSEVLEHVQSPKTVIDEIYRVTKPNGRVVLTLPNEDMINAVKRVILKMGLKNFFAGKYSMSDNMLEEWHVNEISREWILEACKDKFSYVDKSDVPFPGLTFHHITVFSVKK